MTTHFPAEIELTFQYRSMVSDMGPIITAAVFQRLWVDLAFQARVHGNAGLYRADYTAGLQDRLNKLFPLAENAGARIAQCLVRSKFIEVRSNGDWYCPLFYEFNNDLDKHYVPPTLAWAKDWTKFMESVKEAAPTMSNKIPRTAWYRQDGQIIPEIMMNRALVLLNNLDIIIHREAREPQDLPVPLIHAAAEVVAKHGDLKLSAILKRFMAMSRPRQHPLAPPTTEDAIKIFDDLIFFVCPDEGFEAWVKQVERKTDEHEAESIAENITEELAKHIERIAAKP